jgi:hypothetical protein
MHPQWIAKTLFEHRRMAPDGHALLPSAAVHDLSWVGFFFFLCAMYRLGFPSSFRCDVPNSSPSSSTETISSPGVLNPEETSAQSKKQSTLEFLALL